MNLAACLTLNVNDSLPYILIVLQMSLYDNIYCLT